MSKKLPSLPDPAPPFEVVGVQTSHARLGTKEQSLGLCTPRCGKKQTCCEGLPVTVPRETPSGSVEQSLV